MISHLAVANHGVIDDREVAWHAAALDKQIREHAAPLWDKDPFAVAFYGHAERLPTDQAAILGYVNDDGDAAAAGYHTVAAGIIYGLVDLSQSSVASLTGSHEALEIFLDPDLRNTVAGPGARRYYVELCDPVQAQSYEIEVELFGEKRQITVSDFVLPRWFDLPSTRPSDMRTTYLGQNLKPFELASGGYQIVEEPDGSISHLGARVQRRGKVTRPHRIGTRA